MIADFGGLSKTMPVYATVFMIMTMSSIGLPGLNGFIGEFAILQGSFQAFPGRGGGHLGHHPGRGLHALDVPARHVRTHR